MVIEQKIISCLKLRPMTIKELSNTLNIDRHTAAKYLSKLESTGDVVFKSKGKSKIYELTDSNFLKLLKQNNPLSEEIKKIFGLFKEKISIQDSEYNVIWNNKTEDKKKCYELYANRKDVCPNCKASEVINTGVSKTTKINENLEVDIHPIKNKYDETVAVIEIGRYK